MAAEARRVAEAAARKKRMAEERERGQYFIISCMSQLSVSSEGGL